MHPAGTGRAGLGDGSLFATAKEADRSPCQVRWAASRCRMCRATLSARHEDRYLSFFAALHRAD